MNWTCPFCGHAQTVTQPRRDVHLSSIDVGDSAYGETAYRLTSIGCANSECKQVQVHFEFGVGLYSYSGSAPYDLKHVLKSVSILPESSAKPQPEYIPKAIRDDYVEACRIRDLSPKSAATLARRCLQGMIRDFCGITKGRLIDEIGSLRTKVEAGQAPSGVTLETVEAIDHVRGIGNIGAHMEKDINIIVDVDSGEAQALIELIELLFEEWYVARKVRQDRLARVQQIAEAKQGRRTDPAKSAAVVARVSEKHGT